MFSLPASPPKKKKKGKACTEFLKSQTCYLAQVQPHMQKDKAMEITFSDLLHLILGKKIKLATLKYLLFGWKVI